MREAKKKYLEDSKIRMYIKDYLDHQSERSFNVLYAQYVDMIHNLIKRYPDALESDLISEANKSFLSALHNFDNTRTTSFTTYLYDYLWKDINNYLRRHAALFGQRQGVGCKDNLYYESIDSSSNYRHSSLADTENAEESHLKEEVLGWIRYELTPTESLVIMRVFGLGEYDEPVYNEKLGRREDEPRWWGNRYISKTVGTRAKINRISKQCQIPQKTLTQALNSAINKMQSSEEFISISQQLTALQTNRQEA